MFVQHDKNLKPKGSLSRMAMLIAATGLGIGVTGAVAQPVNSDLGITDEASFQSFRDAMYKSEYVRVEYASDPNPRVVASVTALMVFATQNPHATEAELASFLSTYDASLAGAFAGDPDLQLASSFFAAVREFDRGSPLFTDEGLDTRVSARLLEVLDIDIPAPLDYISAQRRMVAYENARLRSFADAPEWSLVLLLALKGQDLDGNANDAIPGLVEALLVAEGFDPVPANPNIDIFAPVTGALSSMPADFAGYSTLLSEVNVSPDIDGTALQSNLENQFAALGASNLTSVGEIQAEMTNPPTLIEAAANGGNVFFNQSQIDEYDAARAAAADDRAQFQWNTMLLLQSDQQAARMYGSSARDFSHIQLETNDTLTKVKLGIQIASSAAQLGIAIKKGEPGDAVAASSDLIINSLDLADEFGAFNSPPPPEEQIFDQLVAVRQDINDMRIAMDERFDEIEVQLGMIYSQINTGFDLIGMQIGDLQTSVNVISLSVIEQQAALERIEDALYGLASQALWLDLAAEVDLVLNFRSGGTDLPYDAASQNYRESSSDLQTFCLSVAETIAFAGELTNELTSFDVALAVLDGVSIGRDVNNLREFPQTLGRPSLFPSRVVAAAPWTQGASVYNQLAQENRWYFAFLYQSELMSAGTPEIDAIIERGEFLNAMMANGRDAQLFDALIDGYQQTITGLTNREAFLIDSVGDLAVPPDCGSGSANLDIFGGLTQPAVQLALPTIPRMRSVGQSNADLPMPNDPIGWNLFITSEQERDIAPLTYALVSEIACADSRNPTVDFQWVINLMGPNDILLNFGFVVNGNPIGQDLGLRVQTNRQLRIRVFDNDGANPFNFGNAGEAQDLLADNIGLWNNLRSHLLNDTQLGGQNLLLAGGPNGSLTLFEIVYDVGFIENGIVNGRSKALEFLEDLQQEAWDLCQSDPAIMDFADAVLDWHALLEAYSTLSLPDMIAGSTVASSALRGDPTLGNFALNVDVGDMYADNEADPANAVFINERLQPLLDAYNDEVDDWVTRPFPGHGYLNYTLAELNELRNSAFALAIDDRYVSGDKLVVDKANGLLANDVDQQFRLIEVESITQPADGTVTLTTSIDPGTLATYKDGGFTFVPNSHFSGATTFTYTSRAAITVVNGTLRYVTSDPATVTIIRTGPTYLLVPDDCPTIADAIGFIESDPNSVIEVAPGTYREHLNTMGKAFTLRSESGDYRDTILSGDLDGDGSSDGRVFTINSGEGRDTRIQGFTIRDGSEPVTPGGGGMLIDNAGPTVVDCWFTENRAFRGGAVSNRSANAFFLNCLFSQNSTPNFGGAFRDSDSETLIASCTFVDNTSPFQGTAVTSTNGSNTILSNTIVWNNGVEPLYFGAGTDTTRAFIQYTNIEGLFPDRATDGPGNISAQPVFVNESEMDYRLNAGSPGIDAGGSNSFSLVGVTTDILGQNRYVDDPDTADTGTPRTGIGAVIDLGAYEFQPPCLADFDGNGLINFFDVVDFIAAFNQPDLDADFAEPFGVLNFFDVVAYIGVFNQGCP